MSKMKIENEDGVWCVNSANCPCLMLSVSNRAENCTPPFTVL